MTDVFTITQPTLTALRYYANDVVTSPRRLVTICMTPVRQLTLPTSPVRAACVRDTLFTLNLRAHVDLARPINGSCCSSADLGRCRRLKQVPESESPW